MKISSLLMAALIAITPVAATATEVVFAGSTDGQFDLYVADITTAQTRRLTETPSEEIMPAAAPDRSQIAFVSNRAGANSLYLMQLAGTASAAEDISAGVGAYANPAFSPSGAKIAVQYAPDPEAPYENTQIVFLDPKTRKQEIVIDSASLKTAENSDSTVVVDRPVWISETLIVYVMAEYSDLEAARLTKSTLYMYDLKKLEQVRVAGGESYYDAEGRAMGFKATMPVVVHEKDHGSSLLFAAIRGATEREPMRVEIGGGEKGLIDLNDSEFFGPMLFADGKWVYGTMNEEGVTGLAWRDGALQAPKTTLPFEGRIINPALIP